MLSFISRRANRNPFFGRLSVIVMKVHIEGQKCEAYMHFIAACKKTILHVFRKRKQSWHMNCRLRKRSRLSKRKRLRSRLWREELKSLLKNRRLNEERKSSKRLSKVLLLPRPSKFKLLLKLISKAVFHFSNSITFVGPCYD